MGFFFGFGSILGGTVQGSNVSGRGFFGFVPTPGPSQLMTIGGPNSTGPWVPFGNGRGGYQSGATNGNFGMGNVNPFPYFFEGQPVVVMAFTSRILGGVADPAGFTVGMFGSLPQNFFTQISLGAPLNLVFTSATATGYNNAYVAPNAQTYTQWGWATGFDITPYLGQTIAVNIS